MAPGCQRWSHQTGLATEKTSASHANVLWFLILSTVVWFCAQTWGLRWFRVLTAPGWSRKIKSFHAGKMTTNSGHSDDLTGWGLLFLDNNQRDRGSVCLSDLFMVQTELRKEQIDAEWLTDSYYPNRRMMMGIICCATTPMRAAPSGHIGHSFSHFSLRISWAPNWYWSSVILPSQSNGKCGLCSFG